MTKQQLTLQNKILRGLVLAIGVFGVVGLVSAFNGSTKYVSERDMYVYEASEDMGSVFGATFSEPTHVTAGEATAVGDFFAYGDMEVDGTLYADGAVTIAGNATLSGTLNNLFSYETMTSVTTNTLTAAESGKTILLATSTPQTLPATSTSAGVYYKFVVSSALTVSSTIKTSDGGNNIQGVIDVNSTMVDCDAEDTITVGASVENVGDYIEVFCDGSNWYVRGDALTAGQFACSAT